MYRVDEVLLDSARADLAARPGLRFVIGGAGTGKTTVCVRLAATRGLAVLDMDARIYGSWHGRFDARRHPVSRAWSEAPDPLAWQLALEPEDFLAFHSATTAEALDLLVAELAGTASGRGPAVLVDGGFGSAATLALVVPSVRIACLDLAPADRARVWTASTDRSAFLDTVAGVTTVADPVARFLALDDALTARMAAESRAAGIPVVERRRDEGTDATVAAVARCLGIDTGGAG